MDYPTLKAIRRDIFVKCEFKDPINDENSLKYQHARRKFNSLFNAISNICKSNGNDSIEKKKKMKRAIQKFLSQNAACYLRLEDREILRLYSLRE